MQTAAQIQQQAQEFNVKNPKIKIQIETLRNEPVELFSYFINCVKDNQFLIVSYILNYCFDDATDRANFSNQQDELGNTAYHYAVEKGFDNIVIILNDKRKFHGIQKFFLFTLQNKQGKTPLQLCCESGHLSTFNVLWERAGKSNHSLLYALQSACVGANETIIKKIIDHPKSNQNNTLVSENYKKILSGDYTDIVKKLVLEKIRSININSKVVSGLKRNNHFEEKLNSDEHKNKKLCTKSTIEQTPLTETTLTKC